MTVTTVSAGVYDRAARVRECRLYNTDVCRLPMQLVPCASAGIAIASGVCRYPAACMEAYRPFAGDVCGKHA